MPTTLAEKKAAIPLEVVPAQNSGADKDSALYDWQQIFRLALERRSRLGRAHLYAILAMLAGAPLPLLIPLLVDEVLLDNPGTIVAFINRLAPVDWQGPTLYIFAVLAVTWALRLIYLGFSVAEVHHFAVVSKQLIFKMRQRLIHHLGRISMREYEDVGSGSVSALLVNDLHTIDNFLGSSLPKMVVSTMMIVGVAVILFFLYWPLALFIFLVNPVIIYAMILLGKQVKELKGKENLSISTFQQATVETLEALQELRAANRERHYLLRMVDLARETRDYGAAFSWRSDAANRISFVIFLLGFDLFRSIAAILVVFSGLTIGKMLAVGGYLWFLLAPTQEVLNMQTAWIAADAALKRINSLLAAKTDPAIPAKNAADPFARRDTVGITLDNLYFSYNEEAQVLNGVSLKIKAGEKVAIVGASGGGKSTLVQLLLGLRQADSGRIFYGGKEILDVGYECVRTHVGCVMQRPSLFRDSIRNNLNLGQEHRDDELWASLEIAQLAATVGDLEQGLETVIGHRGLRLSGGQQQRLALARMVLTNPKVIILDEATSSVDVETETLILDALEKSFAGRTMLIIAHRLAAACRADRAYVFENGEIAEDGDHSSLMERGGLYAQLYGQNSS